MRSKMSAERFQILLRSVLFVIGGAAFLALILATFLHSLLIFMVLIKLEKFIFTEIAPWTGRFYSLLDPSYAKNNIPIIASVSEHQPTAWSSFYFDLQFLVFTFPGFYLLIQDSLA
jgi:dolichyl-diphosphooligosaccharide--protein glycosyltransferase